MNNNKQTMKLYTEEQVHIAMLWALGRHGIYIPNKHYQDLIDLLTPIELPSDDYIEHYANDNTESISFVNGAKWMRDEIGGNK